MRQDKMRVFILTLILLLAITAYSIYHEQKNSQPQESYFSSPTPILNNILTTNI